MGAISTLIVVVSRVWVSNLLWPLPRFSDEVRTPDWLVEWGQGGLLVDTCWNVFSCLALSGACFGALRGSRAAMRAESARQRTYREATSQWRPHPDGEWQSKVEELAERGLTLDALLDFYRRLGTGEAMPCFDPERHTTEDVVRSAIIPLSAPSRSSMAEVLMHDVAVVPEKMVTHNWGNLFADLISAIVAEALGEKEFSKVTFVLTHDIDTLQSWIDVAGVGKQTYWVCAFSLNQHSCICSANPFGRVDSVTGEEYPLCQCGMPKALNKTPPLCPEGRSLECEMNKFHDMMLMLSAWNSNFSQVIAVDARFDIFNRAWCVAEIAAAHEAGMPQSLQLPSRACLMEHQEMLASLKVANMQATRPEDKEEILRRISDHDAFDQSLSSLLLSELLPSWRKHDSSNQMMKVGRIARWQLIARKRSDEVRRLGTPESKGDLAVTPSHSDASMVV